MDEALGMVGLGIMGGVIAGNLLERGGRVTGFDINRVDGRTGPVRPHAISYIAELASAVPVILASLLSRVAKSGLPGFGNSA